MSRLLMVLCAALAACAPAVTADDIATGADTGGPTGSTGTSGGDGDGDVRVDADGDGWSEDVDCDDANPDVNPAAGEVCGDGLDNNCNGQVDSDLACLDSCTAAVASNSYYGCEFFALDLPQFNLEKKFGISVSNPSPVDTVSVTIDTVDGEIATLEVAPRSDATYEDATRANNLGGPGLFDRAYRIRSSHPVAAYQFNSIDTFQAASTDASMLFARHNLARRYFSMDYSSSLFTNNNYVVVYAVEPDTRVEITPGKRR